MHQYTHTALTIRQKLRSDPDISACIRKQWALLSYVNPDNDGACLRENC